MTPDDKEYMYFQKLEKDTLSISPRFINKHIIDDREIEKHTRAVSMKFGDSADHKMIKRFQTKDGIEIDLRTTDNKEQEIKAYFYEDTRGIKTLTVQRWMTKTGNAHKESMVLWGKQLDLLLKFVESLKGVPLNGAGKVKIPLNIALEKADEFQINDKQVIQYLKENPNVIKKVVENEVTESDVISLGYRKQQLTKFENMLEDDSLKEADWQNFFEANTWIFGYGLSYIFQTELDDKKIEQVVSGQDFNSSGKRVDGLLKTAGIIKSLCFVELKTHKTDLLENKPYRGSCWNISKELSGAIAQIQNTVSLSMNKFFDKIQLKDNHGNLTGEEVFNFQPKSFLIIGKLDEFQNEHGVNSDEYRSFELFRKNIFTPEIITFDELYERAKHIVSQGSK